MARLDVRVVGTISGGPPLTMAIPMKASAIFQLGECVALTSGDTIKVAASGEVFGVAADDATTVAGGSTSKPTSTLLKVWPLDDNTIFSMKANTGTPSYKFIGQQCDFSISSTIHGAVLGTTTAAKAELRVVGLDPLDATRVLVTGGRSDSIVTGGWNAGSQFLGNITRAA